MALLATLRAYRVGDFADVFGTSSRRVPDRLRLAFVGSRGAGVTTYLRATLAALGSEQPEAAPLAPLCSESAHWTAARVYDVTPELSLVHLGPITFNTVAEPRDVRALFRLFLGLIELRDGQRSWGRPRLDSFVFCLPAHASEAEVEGLRSVIVLARAQGLPFGLLLLQTDRLPPGATPPPPLRPPPKPECSKDLPPVPAAAPERLSPDATVFPALVIRGGRGVQEPSSRSDGPEQLLARLLSLVKDGDRFLGMDVNLDLAVREQRALDTES